MNAGSARPDVLVMGAPDALAEAEAELSGAGMHVVAVRQPGEFLDRLYTAPAQCLVLPYPPRDAADANLLRDLKSDNLYGHLPLILVLDGAAALRTLDWEAVPADDYLLRPYAPGDLAARVRLCIVRMQRDLQANPLTGLPGNLTVVREAEARLLRGEPFAMGYLDLDHFKPFNDKYGFARGDEVIRMTARILANAVRAMGDPHAYIGHIGGDDFLFLCAPARAEPTCKEILRDFAMIVPDFYDEADRRDGAIASVDRQGAAQRFPLMTCSIAVIDTSLSNIRHFGELSARTAEIKKYAKSLDGSNYVVDRRG